MSMDKTDKLRAELDARGVEWTENDGEHVKVTCWPYMGELMATFAEYDNGTTRFEMDHWCFTSEQAIAATLGGGKCEMKYATEGMKRGWWVCSECGEASDTIESCAGRKPPRYCGNCGKAVKR